MDIHCIVTNGQHIPFEILFQNKGPHICCVLEGIDTIPPFLKAFIDGLQMVVLPPVQNIQNAAECRSIIQTLQNFTSNAPFFIKTELINFLLSNEPDTQRHIQQALGPSYSQIMTQIQFARKEESSARKIQNVYLKHRTSRKFTTEFTANEYFLFSLRSDTKTVAAARAFFIGGEYVDFQMRSGSLIRKPEQSPDSAYTQLVLSASQNDSVETIYAPWKEQPSRRCYESVLAFEELMCASLNPTLLANLDKIYQDLIKFEPPPFSMRFFYRSEKSFPHARFQLMVEMTRRFPDLTPEYLRTMFQVVLRIPPHRTLTDLTGAAYAVNQKFQVSHPNFNKLIVLCLRIWVMSLFSQQFMAICKKEVDPKLMKGRKYREESQFPKSTHFGTFRKEDPILPSLDMFVQPDPNGVIRGADFSEPLFAVENQFQIPKYSQTQFQQGGPSGLTLALLGRLFETQEYPRINTVPSCTLVSPPEFTEIIKIMMCTLVYAVGGHNFLEMIHIISLENVRSVLNKQSQPHCDAIHKDLIFASFNHASLLKALETASQYEKWRRTESAGV